jgi:hypothetical protein
VAQIVSQASYFDEVGIDATNAIEKVTLFRVELDRNRFCDLRNLKRMRQPIAKEIGFDSGEELRLAR